MPTREQYEAAFEKERRNEYPVIDAFEERMGFAVNRSRLEAAARVLACPLKKNPPNWQHGRVIYALGRACLAKHDDVLNWMDIGTAKGFSAVCMSWAFADGHAAGHIVSSDIIDPESTEPRNSIDDGKTIFEFVAPFFASGVSMGFYRVGSFFYPDRIGFAFIDGSHTYHGVKADIAAVTPRQQSGDIIMFDDLQVAGIVQAVSELQGYDMEYIDLLPKRKYAIAVKR